MTILPFGLALAAFGLRVHMHEGFRRCAGDYVTWHQKRAMIAASICVISIAVIFQFFVFYCRLVIAASRRSELSEGVREIAGIAGKKVPAEDFERLLQFVHLCPKRSGDGAKIRAVEVYYNLLHAVGQLAHRAMPRAIAWVERERQNCSYFAAVYLDRSISYGRGLFRQRASGWL